MRLSPLDYPICLDAPRRRRSPMWQPHVPFAFFLVAAARPRLIVELGTFLGDSYCAFCQAVDVLSLNTRCLAVDTWQGDAHSGRYGPDVLADLRAHHDPLYQRFSTLVQQTFDGAVASFAAGTIDLLHVDGFHTYEAVRHDFETWLPKVSQRGIALFHDTNVRTGDFGVYRLWEEVAARYPTFAFDHASGLGVAAIGGEIPGACRPLFDADAGDAATIRRWFEALGQRILDADLYQKAANQAIELKRWDDAATFLRTVLAFDPGAHDVPPVLARCLAAAGKVEEARQVLAAVRPDQEIDPLDVVDLLIAAGKPQAALDILQPMLEQEPARAALLRKLGATLRALGRNEDAARLLQRALEIKATGSG